MLWENRQLVEQNILGCSGRPKGVSGACSTHSLTTSQPFMDFIGRQVTGTPRSSYGAWTCCWTTYISTDAWQFRNWLLVVHLHVSWTKTKDSIDQKPSDLSTPASMSWYSCNEHCIRNNKEHGETWWNIKPQGENCLWRLQNCGSKHIGYLETHYII